MRYPKTAGFSKGVGFPAEENLIVIYFYGLSFPRVSVPFEKKDFFFFLLKFHNSHRR